MANDPEKVSEQDAARFYKAFNEEGYSFQNAIRSLLEERKFSWKFHAQEVPVQLHGKDTHIDLVLRLRGFPCYLSVECKRVNPALNNWVFATASSMYQGSNLGELVAEYRKTTPHEHLFYGIRLVPQGMIPMCQFGRVVKGNKKGDGGNGDRRAIEQAVGQACKGASGLIQGLPGPLRTEASDEGVVVIPVILTTARLFVLKKRLDSADLLTGNLPTDEADVATAPVVYYQYTRSTSLCPCTRVLGAPRWLGDYLRRVHTRTIPIVSSSAIAEFLESFDPERFCFTSAIEDELAASHADNMVICYDPR